jgi:hypothetical protein
VDDRDGLGRLWPESLLRCDAPNKGGMCETEDVRLITQRPQVRIDSEDAGRSPAGGGLSRASGSAPGSTSPASGAAAGPTPTAPVLCRAATGADDLRTSSRGASHSRRSMPVRQ